MEKKQEFIQEVKRAQAGDKEALIQLILYKKNEYYRLAYTYMGNEHDALEALDDMIIKIYEKIHQLKKAESFESWSKTILVNCCRSLLRKRKKIVLVEDWQKFEKGEGHQTLTDPHTQKENHLDLQKMLRQLNHKQQEAIKLKYFQDMDYKKIAEVTNTSIGTVKTRIFNGLKKLRNLYGGEQNEKN